MRRPWFNGDFKGLSENLAPLRRYLQSQVGRPWNKVYSEVCERINPNSAVQLHIWQHLIHYVCTNPYVISGEVGKGWRWYPFVVDPRTGLLRENPKRRRGSMAKKPVPDADRVTVDGQHEYRRLNGLWFELRLAPVPLGRDVFDMAMRQNVRLIPDSLLRSNYGAMVYTASKRQLNKREIRTLRLNEPWPAASPK
jgi:hypothetical protein